MAKKPLEVTPQLLKQLESQGYKVQKKAKTVRKTFLLEEDQMERLRQACFKRNVKIQDAVRDAIEDWLSKKG